MIIAQDPNDLDENPTVFVFRADEGIVIQSAGKYIVIHDVDVGPFLDAVVEIALYMDEESAEIPVLPHDAHVN